MIAMLRVATVATIYFVGFIVVGCSFDRPVGYETLPDGRVVEKTQKVDMWNKAEWSLSEYMYRTWGDD